MNILQTKKRFVSAKASQQLCCVPSRSAILSGSIDCVLRCVTANFEILHSLPCFPLSPFHSVCVM